MGYVEDIRVGQNTADNLGVRDSVKFILKRGMEKFRILEALTQIFTRDVSADTIWGLFNWAGSNWDGTYNNSPALSKAVNPNNTYLELFTTVNAKDSDVTTAATWVSAGTMVFATVIPSTAQSTPIHYNEENIIKATLFVSGTITTAATYFLTNDGGSNWQTATPDNELTFVETGQDLRWRATHGGTTATTLTQIRVTYTL